MKHDAHQQAQELIACRGDGITEAQQAWLDAHLVSCDACREYAEAADELVRALRSVPITAGTELVRTTQARARAHAYQLQQQRERVWLIWISCAVVTLSTALTTPLLWQGFAWVGGWIRVPALLWQTGFIVFWMVPALATSVLLAARGTFLGSRNSAPRG